MLKTKIFQWTSTQKRGILFLFVLVILGQIVYFYTDFSPKEVFSYQEMTNFQQKIDSITQQNKKLNFYPFNPNFITDYKAYQFGISAQALERLRVFREQGKFVNSAQEFQQVTQISDSLLDKISPYFKFPSWATNFKKNQQENKLNYSKSTDNKIIKKDINTATMEDFKEINGIGEKLSERIVMHRQKVQGFSIKEQVAEIYGLEPMVVERIWQRFEIMKLPEIVKKDINSIRKTELTQIPYISYKEAEEILLYRSNVGHINDLDELLNIKSFDALKIKKIKLYLYAQNQN